MDSYLTKLAEFHLILNLVNHFLINYNPAQCPTCLKASIQLKRAEGSREKVEHSSKCVFVPMSNDNFLLYDKSLGSTWYANAYAGCGRPTLNCVLACVGPFNLQVDLKEYSNGLWNELHNHAQMYRNVLQCTPKGPSTLASASLV